MTTKYSVILADPPWAFGDPLPGPKRGAASHYACLSVPDLCLFDVPSVTDDAVLVLWRVASMQLEAIAVARAWGFRGPLAEFVWVKTTNDGDRVRIGMGRRVRNAHEVALIFERGRPKRRPSGGGVSSVLFAPRGAHSAKPGELYDRIERLWDGPYCELFARTPRQGWDGFGDQLPITVTIGTGAADAAQRQRDAERDADMIRSDDQTLAGKFHKPSRFGWLCALSRTLYRLSYALPVESLQPLSEADQKALAAFALDPSGMRPPPWLKPAQSPASLPSASDRLGDGSTPSDGTAGDVD